MKRTKHHLATSIFLGLACFAGALPARDIALPEPQKSGGMPLMEALAKRSTIRTFDVRDLSHQQLSGLLWACFGINRADGKRTAPSALNQQATDIYVLLKQGAYLYDAPANKLTAVEEADIRRLGGTQDFATNAPVMLVFVADLAKMEKISPQTRMEMANLNAGYLSQNAYLYCASEGLATGARASVDANALSPRLKLRAEQKIILAHSVGYPKAAN